MQAGVRARGDPALDGRCGRRLSALREDPLQDGFAPLTDLGLEVLPPPVQRQLRDVGLVRHA